MTLAELCQLIDLDSVTEHTVERIRGELPAYRSIDPGEHHADVRRQLSNQVSALGGGLAIPAEALAAAMELAHTRAGQGVDVDALIGAFHIGDQVLWTALRAAAPGAGEVLADAAGLLLGQLHTLTATLAAVHAEASQILHGRRVTVSQRLVELLGTGEAGAEAAAHAQSLGLSGDAQSLALVWRGPGAEARALELIRGLAATGATGVVAHLATESILVSQGATAGQLGAQADACLTGLPGGIGMPRPGLSGAAQSIADARLAAGAADRLGASAVLRLDECWLDAVVLAEHDRLAAIFAPVTDVARAHPHLADAVTAFAASGMQVTRAAQALNLHPNSLSYRLERWGTLTGWHPRTFDGLRRSLAAIQALGAAGA